MCMLLMLAAVIFWNEQLYYHYENIWHHLFAEYVHENLMYRNWNFQKLVPNKKPCTIFLSVLLGYTASK